jgi:hypothetical protein
VQITIEDNSMMYIYLKSPESHVLNRECMSDVKCNLLYDESDNLIGIKLLNKRENSEISVNGIPQIEQIKLPAVGDVELPTYNATITEKENEITILFNGSLIVHHIKEDICNIDLCDEGIFGIEPIPFTYIGGKEVIKPFIKRDIPLTLTKLE